MPTVILLQCHSWVNLNIDTGSQDNIVDEKTFNNLKIKPKLETAKTRLYGYNTKQQIGTLGQFSTRVLHKTQHILTTFIVTTGKGGKLLSYASAVALQILNEIPKVNVQQVKYVQRDLESELIHKYTSLITGKVGKYNGLGVKFHIDESIRPSKKKLRHHFIFE